MTFVAVEEWEVQPRQRGVRISPPPARRWHVHSLGRYQRAIGVAATFMLHLGAMYLIAVSRSVSPPVVSKETREFVPLLDIRQNVGPAQSPPKRNASNSRADTPVQEREWTLRRLRVSSSALQQPSDTQSRSNSKTAPDPYAGAAPPQVSASTLMPAVDPRCIERWKSQIRARAPRNVGDIFVRIQLDENGKIVDVAFLRDRPSDPVQRIVLEVLLGQFLGKGAGLTEVNVPNLGR